MDYATAWKRFARAQKILGALGSVVALVAAAAGVYFWMYREVNFRDATVLFYNTNAKNFAVASRQIQRCVQEALMAGVQNRQAGNSDVKKCYETASQPAPENFVANIAFTNDGPDNVAGIEVHLGIRSASGVVSKTTSKIAFLALHDRGVIETLPIPFRPIADTLCISYDSGLLRRSYIAFEGRPGDASYGILGALSPQVQHPAARGRRWLTWLFGDGCG